MRGNGLKYGFLSTYKTTVFVRRIDYFRFELSQPIDEGAVSPSIRECFAAFAIILQGDHQFSEEEGMNLRLVFTPSGSI